MVRRRKEQSVTQDQRSARAIKALIADISEDGQLLSRVTLAPISATTRRNLVRLNVIPKGVRCLAHVLYPELRLEYLLYQDGHCKRRRMLVLK